MRLRLASSLRSAYAVGLMTEDTFAHRIDQLYGGSHVLNPDLLVGDLDFRTRRRPMWDRLTRVRQRLRSRPADEAALPILALDWSGASEQLLVGRGSRCDLVVGNQTVSRRHAQLFFRDGGWILLDLDSRNGTFINGQRVRRSQLLPGDVLTLGAERLRVD